MKKILEKLISIPKITYADVRIEERETTSILFRGKNLEKIEKKEERGGIIRFFINGNWGYVSFNKINGSLENVLKGVVKATKKLPRRERSLFLLPPFKKVINIEKDKDPRRTPLEVKKELLERYNQILLKPEKIVSTVSIYQDMYIKKVFLSTEGRYIEEERNYEGIGLTAIAKDGSNIQTYSRAFGKRKGFKYLKDKEEIAENVAKTAVDLLSAEPVSAGVYTVIVDPLLAGIFIHEAFGHLSEGDHLQGNENLKRLMHVGKKYGVEFLNAVDDGTIKEERGSIGFDEDGVEAKKTYLIYEGAIAGHLNSKETGYELGEAPTGNARSINYRFPPIVRMTNTIIEKGPHKKEELFDTKKAIYVIGSRGGMTELESFVFSAQYGYLIEKGKKKKMLRDITLSGNVFETLRNIEMIADDLIIFGGIGGCGKNGQQPLPVGLGGPHLRIKNVVIGGK